MVFDGSVKSDFLKLVATDETLKTSLIDFASADFNSIRENLIKYIKAVYPIEFQNFTESDLGIMLLELVAYQGHLSSHKADFLANENYIRTAQSRKTVKKLLELVGVRMKGPISAAADARATFTSPSLPITIPAANRVVNITSPEDGGNISYTLYKVVNGQLDVANNTGDIVLQGSEADDSASSIFTNLVLLEGSFVTETGIFDATELVKSIQLTESPVVERSLEVFIDGDSNTSGAYIQVDNIFFASGESDQKFQVVTDDNFAATLIFGDNNLGRAPRAGDTFTVFYRVGGGSRGNIANSVINVTLTAGAETAVLENISQGTGGSDAETVAHAKRFGPLTFRRQDRIVTLQDVKTFVNQYVGSFGNLGKATAAVRKAFCSANVIDVYVLEKANDLQLRRATPQFKLDLLEKMNVKKMLTDEFVIVDGLIRTIDLVVSLRVDKELRGSEEAIKLKARDAILEFFSVDNNDFGKTVVLQELNREIFRLPEVRFSTIDNFKSDIVIDFNEIVQLNNLTIHLTLV